jgi:hypothetical protein
VEKSGSWYDACIYSHVVVEGRGPLLHLPNAMYMPNLFIILRMEMDTRFIECGTFGFSLMGCFLVAKRWISCALSVYSYKPSYYTVPCICLIAKWKFEVWRKIHECVENSCVIFPSLRLLDWRGFVSIRGITGTCPLKANCGQWYKRNIFFKQV